MSSLATRNHLLLSLSKDDLALLGTLEVCQLKLRQSLETAGAAVKDVYFPESAMASVVAHTPRHRDIEVGIIGNEGMTGLALVQGDSQSPFETFVQIAGTARSMSAIRLMEAVTASPTLKAILLLHGRAFNLQVASTTAANGSHMIEARLARWLLMVADRVGNDYRITHEFLGLMLGVRRSGVTAALQQLEGRHLIRSTRGNVVIVDRTALVAAAQGSYGMAEREEERLLG
jgi:CRP-like cAMP-binding protein